MEKRRGIINSDRKAWPDKDALLDLSPICAANFEIEAAWGFKYDLSPSSTNMYQCLILDVVGIAVIISIEIKYIM